MKVVNVTYDDLVRLSNFDAASKSYRTTGFGTNKTAGTNNVTTDLITLMQRSRYLIDNNAYARNAMRIVSHNTVKNGIQFKFENEQSVLANNFKSWATANKLTQLQLLVIKTIFTSGSVLIRKIKKRKGRSSTPLSLQILEPDYINLNKHNTKLSNGGYILAGKEFNSKDELVAYHLHKNHPGNVTTFHNDNYATIRVKADDILHIFEINRPDQIHGLPMLTTALTRLAHYDEYCDAKLEQQKIATFLALLIRGAEDVNISVPDSYGNVDNENKNELNKESKMTPGMIANIGNNDVSVVNPPNADNSEQYAKSVIREIAASIGITYEQLANDYSQVNFSSAKMGRIEFISNVMQWQSMMINQFLNPVYNWFLDASNVSNNTTNTHINWIAPAVTNVDEEKEAKAYREMIRNGLMTQSEAISLLGRDPDKFFDEYASDLEKLDSKNIILDSDARKTARGGTLQDATDNNDQ